MWMNLTNLLREKDFQMDSEGKVQLNDIYEKAIITMIQKGWNKVMVKGIPGKWEKDESTECKPNGIRYGYSSS